ncbi:MAG: organoarsenical effux MFS transporter ArsJ [Kordiimonas sp.]
MTDLKSYSVVTAAYWSFTITDGALRMLVLLHFHTLGYKPLDLAFLFLLYEAMGVLTNFLGGWVGAKFGLRITLFSGLFLQITALLILSVLPPELTLSMSVLYVMATQALSGIAKDLTKMSSKSAVKLVVSDNKNGQLFKWVSILTGSKNALKGVGFFVGGYLLNTIGFDAALVSMSGGLALILVSCFAYVRTELGKAKSKIHGKDLFSKSREINFLSAARLFLFASRDIWFVVGLPIFLSDIAGWSFHQIGSFMAIWIIGYGIIQASVPKVLHRTKTSNSAASAAKLWGSILAFTPILIGLGLTETGNLFISDLFSDNDGVIFLIGGLIVFGFVFAVNSALHSYLIVAYSDSDKVSLNVGFYYMANALGRLAGTLLSGLIYQSFGLVACLLVSGGAVVVAVLFTMPLSDKTKLRTEG